MILPLNTPKNCTNIQKQYLRNISTSIYIGEPVNSEAFETKSRLFEKIIIITNLKSSYFPFITFIPSLPLSLAILITSTIAPYLCN